MAKSIFKHLESLPLDEGNLVLGVDPTSNIRSKSCVNQAFIASNSLSRFRNLLRLNRQSFNNINENTFLGVSYILEELLVYLLTASSISNITNTEITEHYRRRQINISQGKLLPSFKYCQDTLFSGFKFWGGLYGTLQYYMNLKEEYQEYYTPSQLVYLSSLKLAELSGTLAYAEYLNTSLQDYKLISSTFTNLSNLINDPSNDADKGIYDFSKIVITSTPLISNVGRNLRFYQDWIPKVYNWYIQLVDNDVVKEVIENPITNQQRAENTLIKVFNVISQRGLDNFSFKNLFANFIRQTINPIMFDILDEVTLIRAQSTYIDINEESKTFEQSLTDEFHKTINLTEQSIDYRTSSNLILSVLAPPGGYTMLQVALAANLINRAYILSYKERRDQTLVQETTLYRRILKLIGFAGILLIKTNKKHLQTQGINILKMFNLALTNIQPNNLLDL